MADYGHPITFGISLTPYVDGVAELERLAHAAESAGLDYIAMQDHAYNPEFFDTWTLITYLARTNRITFVPDVADLQLRPPAMLAKAVASLSVLTGGRIILGVGGGASADAVAAMGGTRRSTGEMVAFTDEAVHVIRLALAGGAVNLQGRHQSVDYEAGPVPPNAMPIWLGSVGPRMLELTGCAGDGWLSPLSSYLPPPEVHARQKLIDEAAIAAGRRPADVRRIYNVIGAIGPAHRGRGLYGEAELWAKALTEYAFDLGFDTFIFWHTTSPLTQLELFASEVAPRVQLQVGEARRSSAGTSRG